MKVALVYTSTTPELIELVEKEVGDVLPRETEVASYQDPSILAEVRDAGYVTAPPAARLVGMYMTAVSEGADAILNLCSSVGEVADAAQEMDEVDRAGAGGVHGPVPPVCGGPLPQRCDRRGTGRPVLRLGGLEAAAAVGGAAGI